MGLERGAKGRPGFVDRILGIDVFLDQDVGSLPGLKAADCLGQLLLCS
jgi:hypothetical protein